MKEDEFKIRITSRKFLGTCAFTLIGLLVVFLFMFYGRDSQTGEMLDGTLKSLKMILTYLFCVFSVYVGGNVSEKLINRQLEKIK